MDLTDEARAARAARYAAVLRWLGVFEMLALDRAEPLYRELGLNPAHAAVWRAVARQFLQRYYAQVMDGGHWEHWTVEQGEALVRDALGYATELAGVEAAQALYAWGMGTFSQEQDGPDQAWRWSRALLHLRRDQRLVVPPPHLPAARQAILEQAVDLLLEPPTGELIAAAVAQPPSEWDARVAQHYEQRHAADPGDVSPLDWAHATIDERRMRDVWAVLKRSFTPDDFQTLLAWANALPGSGNRPPLTLPPW